MANLDCYRLIISLLIKDAQALEALSQVSKYHNYITKKIFGEHLRTRIYNDNIILTRSIDKIQRIDSACLSPDDVKIYNQMISAANKYLLKVIVNINNDNGIVIIINRKEKQEYGYTLIVENCKYIAMSKYMVPNVSYMNTRKLIELYKDKKITFERLVN